MERAAHAPRWRRAAEALGQFLFPRACAACDGLLGDSDRGMVCGRCWARMPVLRAPQCTRCGHPRPARGDCPVCPLLPPYVRAVRSYCWVPDDIASAIVYALKYDDWPAVADGMAERMARLAWPQDVLDERAAVIPVPLAPVKQRTRGYNQAERLGAALARRWGIPQWPHALVRTRATPSQTTLSPGERLANVHGAFAVADAATADALRGQHVVLVDDVLTTGATLNACASVLFAAGARTLSYITFGRARTSADRPQ